MSGVLLCEVFMNKLFNHPTCEHAMYNCPCMKYPSVELTSHHLNDCQCDLFMIMLSPIS